MFNVLICERRLYLTPFSPDRTATRKQDRMIDTYGTIGNVSSDQIRGDSVVRDGVGTFGDPRD